MFFLGNGMSKFMRNDVRSPAVALFVENFVLKKKSALVLRLLFQDFEKKIRITFSHVGKVRGKSP